MRRLSPRRGERWNSHPFHERQALGMRPPSIQRLRQIRVHLGRRADRAAVSFRSRMWFKDHFLKATP